MLRKLLKYDLRIMYKYLFVFYLIILGCAIISRILSELNTNIFFIKFIYEFFKGAMGGFIIGAVINNGMHTWEYLRQDFYGDRSYLMHTLPLSPATLFLSKFLCVLITIFTTATVSLLGVLITYGTPETFNALGAVADQIGGTGTLVRFIILFVILVYLEFVFITLCGVTGSIIGHRFNSHKIVFSVIAGFIIFAIFNILVIDSAYIWGQFDPEIGRIFTGNTISLHALNSIFIGGIILYLLTISALYLTNVKLLKREVNVD